MNRRRFLALSACAVAAAGPADAVWRGTALGADVTLRVRGARPADARAFFDEAQRALRGVEDRFSLHRGSDLTRLNAIGRLDHPSEEFLSLLTLAGQVHAATGGAFDPTVQPLWQALRAGADPAPARVLIGWPAVEATPEAVRLPRPGMALTLNGIAQGHAADRLAAVARDHGLGEILIDTGEIAGLGRDWQAGIEATGGSMLRQVTLRDRALATSAPMGTRIGPEGRAPHILDPRGGAPRWTVAAASADRAAVADALSTAFCVMDRPAIDRALRAFPGARLEALSPASA